MKNARKISADESGSAFLGENAVALDEPGWAQITDALERPPRVVPELLDLLSRKAPWD
jgi:uncharacterized protein (DUF1778 family)